MYEVTTHKPSDAPTIAIHALSFGPPLLAKSSKIFILKHVKAPTMYYSYRAVNLISHACGRQYEHDDEVQTMRRLLWFHFSDLDDSAGLFKRLIRSATSLSSCDPILADKSPNSRT